MIHTPPACASDGIRNSSSGLLYGICYMDGVLIRYRFNAVVCSSKMKLCVAYFELKLLF